jgi:membrane protease subunit HflC
MNRSLLGVTVLLIAAMLTSACLFVVKETERAVVLKFGEVVRPDVDPGIHWKIPFVHTVRRFDGRILTMDARAERYLTLEKKALMVDAYAKWRIIDVRKYYTATQGEETRAQALLGQRINDGLRNEIGRRDMHEVVSGERDQLMEALTRELNNVAKSELGVEVVDIRVKRIDLPAEVSPKVYERMKSEREREAREHRSRGQELAEGIRAAADRERTIIQSEAYRDAERLRGEGDAVAAQVYADAYNKNPEFYAFWRSLAAYENSFRNKSDVLVISPDSDFFKYMESQTGKR